MAVQRSANLLSVEQMAAATGVKVATLRKMARSNSVTEVGGLFLAADVPRLRSLNRKVLESKGRTLPELGPPPDAWAGGGEVRSVTAEADERQWRGPETDWHTQVERDLPHSDNPEDQWPSEVPVVFEGGNPDEPMYTLPVRRMNTEWGWGQVQEPDYKHLVCVKTWPLLAAALHHDLVTWIWGPPGAGKTADVQYTAAALRIPVIRVNLMGDMTRDDLIGSKEVTTEGGQSVTVFRPGPALLAGMHGAILLLDEVSAAPPEVLFALQGLLEAPRRDDGRRSYLCPVNSRTYLFDPRFRIVMTDNTNGGGDVTGVHAGVNPMNSALTDRVGVWIRRSYLAHGDWVNMLVERTGLDEGSAKRLVDLAERVNETSTVAGADNATMQMALSPRVTITIAELAASLGSLKLGVEAGLLNRMRTNDPDRAAILKLIEAAGW